MSTETTNLEDDVAMCVGCGLCLPHCPTFRVTGEESHSPRGRIALIQASLGQEITSDEARAFLDTCVQCRGCEPACPSGVPYGRILEAVNRRDEHEGRQPRLVLRAFLSILRRPLMLAFAGRFVLVLRRVPALRILVPGNLRLRGVRRIRGKRVVLLQDDPDVWLFTGCVMNAWFRDVHRAAVALIGVTGASVGTANSGGECCGALHLHSGAEIRARAIATRVIASMPGNSPILVDAAGCGAMLKDYGQLLGTDVARAFSSRVLDIHDWIDANSATLQMHARDAGVSMSGPVVVQEPCHLRHVQKVFVADVLERFVPVLRLDDDGVCCGAGGAYSLVQPGMAADIRSRKTAAILRADPHRSARVVTANPGCHLHLAADGHDMRSSVEVIAEALGLVPAEQRGR